jgi:hypothetical protein
MDTIPATRRQLSCFALLVLVVPSVGIQAQPVSYPLHTGDQWEYAAFVPNAPWKVAHDTVMPNGKTYRTIISQGYPSGDTSFYWQYHRQEGNQVFSFHTYTQQEILLFDFDASVGDTFSVYPLQSGVGRVILQAKSMDTLFGIARRHWVFLHDPSSYAIDEEIRLEVTDTLGITGFFNVNGPGGRITGAIIDGRSYGTIVGIPKESPPAELTFQLDQPFPNPFNPESTFRLQVKRTEFLTVQVYNPLGQEQSTVWSGVLTPGSYTFRWDAGTHSAGMYIIRAEGRSSQQSRKVILLK